MSSKSRPAAYFLWISQSDDRIAGGPGTGSRWPRAKWRNAYQAFV